MSVNDLNAFSITHTIIGDGIWCWFQAIKCITSVRIGPDFASQIAINLVVVLLLIQAIGRRLPNINDSVCNRLLGHGVNHMAMHVGDFAIIYAVNNGILILDFRSIMAKEGTEDRTGCIAISSFSSQFESDFVNEPAKIVKI